MTKRTCHAVFRLDAGATVGMGHFMRCNALAATFVDNGWTVDYAVNSGGQDAVFARTGRQPLVVSSSPGSAQAMAAQWPRGVDLLVVDHYGLDADFEKACRPWAKRIAVIDDMTDRTHACDVLLNPSPGIDADEYATTAPDGCQFLLGPRFALLRPQFSSAHEGKHAAPTTADRLLVTMGGSDPENLTGRVVEALSLRSEMPGTRIILGSAYAFGDQTKARVKKLSDRISVYEDVDDMAAHMTWCDMAVSASGSTTWELCAMGVPALYVQTADNQNAVVRAIKEHDVGLVLGAQADVTVKDIAEGIDTLSQDQKRREVYAVHGQALVDGQGSRRVVENFTL